MAHDVRSAFAQDALDRELELLDLGDVHPGQESGPTTPIIATPNATIVFGSEDRLLDHTRHSRDRAGSADAARAHGRNGGKRPHRGLDLWSDRPSSSSVDPTERHRAGPRGRTGRAVHEGLQASGRVVDGDPVDLDVPVPTVPAGHPEAWHALGDAVQAAEASGEPDDDVAGGAPVQATTETKPEPWRSRPRATSSPTKRGISGKSAERFPPEASC